MLISGNNNLSQLKQSLETAKHFLLSDDDARAIFTHLTETIKQHWQGVCDEAELSDPIIGFDISRNNARPVDSKPICRLHQQQAALNGQNTHRGSRDIRRLYPAGCHVRDQDSSKRRTILG
jgi:hypothetical protein